MGRSAARSAFAILGIRLSATQIFLIHARRLMKMLAALDRDVQIGPQFETRHDLVTAVMRSG